MTERDDPEPQPFGVLPSRRRYAAVERVDPEEVLGRLVELDVQGWEAPAGADRRLGPAAEEFHEAFDLGADADDIAAGDADGVALAAIQGLTTRVATQRERIEHQQHRLDAQQETIDELRDDLEALRETVEDIVDGIVSLRTEVHDDR
jgi:uncharacterized coiled-coil protein SlyX